jgi:hypothetical protein
MVYWLFLFLSAVAPLVLFGLVLCLSTRCICGPVYVCCSSLGLHTINLPHPHLRRHLSCLLHRSPPSSSYRSMRRQRWRLRVTRRQRASRRQRALPEARRALHGSPNRGARGRGTRRAGVPLRRLRWRVRRCRPSPRRRLLGLPRDG